MQRTPLLGTAAVAAAVFCGAPAQAQAQQQQIPNIIMIISDDTGLATLGLPDADDVSGVNQAPEHSDHMTRT
jgi:hypothetical protein